MSPGPVKLAGLRFWKVAIEERVAGVMVVFFLEGLVLYWKVVGVGGNGGRIKTNGKWIE